MNRAAFVIGLLALAAGAALFALRPAPSRMRANAAKPSWVIPTRPEFYDPVFTEKALGAPVAGSSVQDASRDVRAVVVPHHLLAAALIAETLRAAATRPVKRVVIIGPNHEDVGGAAVITADAAWTTPGGRVETDPEAVADLAAVTGAHRDPSAFDAEHSVGAIVPFVERIFPDARIVPVIVSSKALRSDAEALAAWIAKPREETLVVFSVDFSHYLAEPAALRRDAETRATIERGDIVSLLKYRSEHLDAPTVIATMLLSARAAGWRVDITHHATANDFLEIKSGSITTYFTMLIGT